MCVSVCVYILVKIRVQRIEAEGRPHKKKAARPKTIATVSKVIGTRKVP